MKENFEYISSHLDSLDKSAYRIYEALQKSRDSGEYLKYKNAYACLEGLHKEIRSFRWEVEEMRSDLKDKEIRQNYSRKVRKRVFGGYVYLPPSKETELVDLKSS